MLAELLMILFLLVMDVFVIIAIISFISTSLYYWLYERDIIEYEDEDLDRKWIDRREGKIMIFQKILLIAILIITILLLMSICAYIGCLIYMHKTKDEPPTKSEWKIMEWNV